MDTCSKKSLSYPIKKVVSQIIGHMQTHGHMWTHALKKAFLIQKKVVSQIIGHMQTHGHMRTHEITKD